MHIYSSPSLEYILVQACLTQTCQITLVYLHVWYNILYILYSLKIGQYFNLPSKWVQMILTEFNLMVLRFKDVLSSSQQWPSTLPLGLVIVYSN